MPVSQLSLCRDLRFQKAFIFPQIGIYISKHREKMLKMFRQMANNYINAVVHLVFISMILNALFY